MIWLLINAIIERGDGMKLPSVIDMLANLMVYRVGEVSKKRQRFAQRFLTAAEAAYPGTGWYERLVEAGSLGRNTVEEPWTKPAGTRGTELPEWCEHCDRILPSKRQGFKRVPCPCRKGKT